MNMIHYLSHVASIEVSDSQLVGLRHKALNSTQNVHGIPIESTHYFVLLFLFLSNCFLNKWGLLDLF